MKATYRWDDTRGLVSDAWGRGMIRRHYRTLRKHAVPRQEARHIVYQLLLAGNELEAVTA